MPDASKSLDEFMITGDLLTWLAVRAHVYVALRHPDNTNSVARSIVLSFIRDLDCEMVTVGFLTSAEVRESRMGIAELLDS